MNSINSHSDDVLQAVTARIFTKGTGTCKVKTSNRQKKRILLVDDNKELLELLERILTEHGFSVTPFSDGMEAIQCFSKKQYDLVLTDVRMPRVTGIDVADYIKSQKSDVPIIALTGTPFSTKGVFDEVIAKPVDSFKLVDVIQTYCSK